MTVDPLGVGAPPRATAKVTPRYGLPDGAIMASDDDPYGNKPETRFGRPTGRSGGGGDRGAPTPFGVDGGGYGEKDIYAIFSSMPSEQIARLQNQMRGVGLIGPQASLVVGGVDNTTRSAMAELLGMANVRGMDWEDALRQLTEVGGVRGLKQKEIEYETQLHTYTPTDPARVRLTAEQAFREALGRKPKKAELERFVTRFSAAERQAQQTGFDAQDEVRRESVGRAANAAGVTPAAAHGGGTESEELERRLGALIADAPGKITMGAKTRSYEEQVALYEKYKRGGPKAAKPGRSKHGDGRANDLRYDNDGTRQWVIENAHRYGLALPIYDPKLPRSHDESWHVEVAKGSPGPTFDQPGPNHPISRSIEVQQPDLGAQAVEYARNENPTETAAYDIGQQFNNLVALLGKGVI